LSNNVNNAFNPTFNDGFGTFNNGLPLGAKGFAKAPDIDVAVKLAAAGGSISNGQLILGDVSQAVGCLVSSTSQIRGSYDYNSNSRRLTYNFTFGDNEPLYNNRMLFNGTSTLIHIHGPALRGGTAPVQLTIKGDSMNGSVILSALQATQLNAGMWYMNIHSNQCPDGEIRAQLDIGYAVDALGLTPGQIGAFSSNLDGGFVAEDLQILGDVFQSVKCPAPSKAKIRGTYSYDESSRRFKYNFTYGDNSPNFDNLLLFRNAKATAISFQGPALRNETGPVQMVVNKFAGTKILSRMQVDQLKGGSWYLNIKSDLCPFGEIRAQLDINTSLGLNVLPGLEGVGQANSPLNGQQGVGLSSTLGLDANLKAKDFVVPPLLLAGGLPILGDVSQSLNCFAKSRTQIRGSYTFDLSTRWFTYRFTFGDNVPIYNNRRMFENKRTTMIHFHGPAPRGGTAAVQLTIPIQGLSSGSTELTLEQASQLQQGLWYLNIHSEYCPQGEIRAQLDSGLGNGGKIDTNFNNGFIKTDNSGFASTKNAFGIASINNAKIKSSALRVPQNNFNSAAASFSIGNNGVGISNFNNGIGISSPQNGFGIGNTGFGVSNNGFGASYNGFGFGGNYIRRSPEHSESSTIDAKLQVDTVKQ
jgi:hypothetical protein